MYGKTEGMVLWKNSETICVAGVVMVKIKIFIQNNNTLWNYNFFVIKTVLDFLTLNKILFHC